MVGSEWLIEHIYKVLHDSWPVRETSFPSGLPPATLSTRSASHKSGIMFTFVFELIEMPRKRMSRSDDNAP